MADAKKADEQDNTDNKPKKTPAKKASGKTSSAAKASSSAKDASGAAESSSKVTVKQSPTAEVLELPKIITRPPYIFLLCLMAGITLEWLFTSYDGMSAIGVVGFLLFIGALATMRWSFKTMEAAGTTVPTDTPVEAIVTDGPYQYSRNPIYVAFIFGFIGLSFMSNSLWMFVMVIPLFFTLALGVIIPEEEYLTQKFGDEYKDYKKKVRRWI